MSLTPLQVSGVVFALLKVFDGLNEWEKEFLGGIVRIGSGKCNEFTSEQVKTLGTIYFQRVLRPMLPIYLQTDPRKKPVDGGQDLDEADGGLSNYPGLDGKN
jgi:hypothetical protein